MKHQRHRQCPHLAEIHAIGALPEEDTRLLSEHLESSCRMCEEELRQYGEVAADIAAGVAAPPPPSLRARLLERIEAEATPPDSPQRWKTWGGDEPVSSYLLRAGEGAWETTGVPGVSVRRLSVDPARDAATMLIRMEAGAGWPSHRHGGREECYVLSGDLRIGDLVMRAGDYQRVEAESVHPCQFTEEGCTLLIISSLQDEILT